MKKCSKKAMVPAEIRKAFVPIKKPTKGKQQSRKSGSERE